MLLMMIIAISNCYGQVTNNGLPLSWTSNQIENIPPVTLPEIDLEKYRTEDAVNDLRNDVPWRFGAEIVVDYNLNNSGVWSNLQNGDRVWRIRLHSENAKTMNFIFSDFYMPEGATLYLYNHDKTDLLGAYDDRQNNDERVLGTWLVVGDDIYLEYYEPKNVINQGKLELFKVIHGYRIAQDRFKDPEDGFNWSENCNYDVNCDMGEINALKAKSKKAVALIIVNNDSHCTGTLVNNTNNDGTPYFLTANHCYSNPSTWSFRFNWISENPVCAAIQNSTNNTNHNTISGATLKARSSNTDFCLLQINNSIPSSWNVVYSGWNRSATAPEFTYGIHHPYGDIMKVCIDSDAPSLLDNNKYWFITKWDFGVTEGGSSGSGLFDNQGRLIGQLYGGDANCNGLVYNGRYDQYGAITTSWNGTAPNNRLKDWLDPINSEAMIIDQYPEPPVLQYNTKVVIQGLRNFQCDKNINPVAAITNLGSQVLTSLNYIITVNGSETPLMTWTGSLATGEEATISLGSFTNLSGNHTIKIATSLPNGATDMDTSDDSFSKSFSVVPEINATSLTLEYQTDNYPDETAWKLEDLNGNIIESGFGSDYLSNTLYTFNFSLVNNNCYKFIMTDIYGDGICCTSGNGSVTLTTNTGEVLGSGGNFNSEFIRYFRVFDPLSVSEFDINYDLNIYPNPSSGIFTVNSNVQKQYEFSLYNTLGQLIKTGKTNTGSNIDLTNNSSGIYILNLLETESNTSKSFKIIKN